jgi:hypothetical protein
MIHFTHRINLHATVVKVKNRLIKNPEFTTVICVPFRYVLNVLKKLRLYGSKRMCLQTKKRMDKINDV